MRCNLDLSLDVVSTFTGGRVGGWSEDWRVMLNSTQDQIKLKLKFELSLAICVHNVKLPVPVFRYIYRLVSRRTMNNCHAQLKL